MASKKPVFSVGMSSSQNNAVSSRATLEEMRAKKEYNFQFIPKEKIIPNEKNKMYPQVEIDSLKESIRLEGLIHNLCVMFDASNDNYRIVSGERRYRAICALSEEDYKRMFPLGIPVKVEKSNLSEIDEEILLIKANKEKRDETPELKRLEIIRLNELYEAKRARGEEIPNIAVAISETTGMSQRMTKNYLATQYLIPELAEILDNRGMTVTDGAAIASLPDDAQRQILDIIKKTGSVGKTDIAAVKAAEDEKKKIAKELLEAQKELKEKTVRLQVLEKQISKTEKNVKTVSKDEEISIADEVEELRKEKEFAVNEYKKLENKIRKLQESQKEKEKRNIDVSDKDLKRLSIIAKLEQTISSLENEITILKANKNILSEDDSLRERAKLISERLVRILG